MVKNSLSILEFEEAYFERVWGGQRLRKRFGKDIPRSVPIGEAWLISDHPQHTSVVAGGPHAGTTLHDLVARDSEAVLGTRARPTPNGRFPLILKLLDTADYLSVQVHPDDATAARLQESDLGKTEMWYVLDSEPQSELICGLNAETSKDAFEAAIRENRVLDMLQRIPVNRGDAVFVPAGTVHAIAPGCLLAEIQQNSDLTYRIYDWGRENQPGKRRPLHIDKALEAVHLDGDQPAGNAVNALKIPTEGARRNILAACQYFAAESIDLSGSYRRDTGAETFHLLLGVRGGQTVRTADAECSLRPGCALFVAGAMDSFEVSGEGLFLDYYVPDLDRDVLQPLLAAGHPRNAILALSGDLARVRQSS